MRYTKRDMENAFAAGKFAESFTKWIDEYHPVPDTYIASVDPYRTDAGDKNEAVVCVVKKDENGKFVTQYIGRPGEDSVKSYEELDEKVRAWNEKISKQLKKAEYPMTPKEAFRKQQWWDICTKMAIVEYNYTNPSQVRVFAHSGEPEATPQNSYMGQFWASDIRVTTLQDRLKPDDVTILIWSPMADGEWNVRDTKTLLTEL